MGRYSEAVVEFRMRLQEIGDAEEQRQSSENKNAKDISKAEQYKI